MKNKFLPLPILGFCWLFAASCGSKQEKKEASAEVTLDAFAVKKENVKSQLTLPGELQGYYETGIVAKVNGYIKNMLVDIGDKVHRGQLLVELEAPELISQLATAYSEEQAKGAMFNNTKGRYIRLRQTNSTPGAVSPYDMDMAKTSVISDSLGYLAAKAKHESIKELVAYLRITAPFDGVITERALAPGAFVGPNEKMGTPMLKLKNESRLRLQIAVPEKHLEEVTVGEIVTFKVKSFPSESFQGKITRLSHNLNVMLRSEIVEIEIANQDGKLLPGMYATAVIPIKRQELSIVVPKTAVVTSMEKQFVIKIKNGNVTYVDVEKGEEQNEDVEVFGTLDAGDTLLNKASDEIKEATKVIITLKDGITKTEKEISATKKG